MKSLLKNVKILKFEDLLKINGGYSGSSGGGATSTHTSKCSTSGRSSSGNYSTTGTRTSSCSSSRTTTSSSYSGSSGGSSKNNSKNSGTSTLSQSSYSGSSAGKNLNSERITFFGDGTGYSSVSGFFDGRSAYNTTSAGSKTDYTRSNQRDFCGLPENIAAGADKNTFGKTACAATSLLNELSEIYTREFGAELSDKAMQKAMEDAIRQGGIDANDATVLSWENAANAMAKSLGLTGKFTYAGNIKNADITIYGLDKDPTKKGCEHFVSSIGNDRYYDPWSGTIGNISDFAKNGWKVEYRGLNYKK